MSGNSHPDRVTEPISVDRIALLLGHPEGDACGVIDQALAVADRMLGGDAEVTP